MVSISNTRVAISRFVVRIRFGCFGGCDIGGSFGVDFFNAVSPFGNQLAAAGESGFQFGHIGLNGFQRIDLQEFWG